MQNLSLHLAAALYFADKFTMIVCGVDDELWQFLPWAKTTTRKAKLRFFIHEPVAGPPKSSGSELSLKLDPQVEPSIITLFRELLGVTPKAIFTYTSPKNPISIKYNVFLWYGYKDGEADELELWSKFFIACKAKLFLYTKKGDWAEFCKLCDKTSGVIMVSMSSQFQHSISQKIVVCC